MIVIGYIGNGVDQDGHFLGVKGVGKDTVAQMVHALMQNQTEIIHFADALKQQVAECYGLSLQEWDTPEKKQEPLPSYPHCSLRLLLEKTGTDVIRNFTLPGLLPNPQNTWIHKMEDRILSLQLDPIERFTAQTWDLRPFEFEDSTYKIPHLGVCFRDLVRRMKQQFEAAGLPMPVRRSMRMTQMIQIPDCRFVNEYAFLKRLPQRKGFWVFVVEVKRIFPRVSSDHGAESHHPSNARYEEMKPDYVIENSGSLEELQTSVVRMLQQLKIKSQ